MHFQPANFKLLTAKHCIIGVGQVVTYL